MSRRKIGQEELMFKARGATSQSSLDELARLIDWAPLARELDGIHSASKGEPAWPPLASFKALLIAVWYDLSDVKLAEALDDRASFRRFCGFSSSDLTPERTAFVRFRKELVARGLDKTLFDAVTCQLKAKAVTVKTGTLIDATVIASASHQDGDAKWSAHRTRKAVQWPMLRQAKLPETLPSPPRNLKAAHRSHYTASKHMLVPMLIRHLSKSYPLLPEMFTMIGRAMLPYRTIQVPFMRTAPIEARLLPPQLKPRADFLKSFKPASGDVLGIMLYKSLRIGIIACNAFAAGSRRSSARGSEVTACAGCDGVDWPKLLFKFA